VALFDEGGSGIILWAPFLFQGTEVLRAHHKRFSKNVGLMDNGYPWILGAV